MPLDMQPLDFHMGSALRARDLKHALIGLGVGSQDIAGRLQRRRLSHDDLAVSKAQRPTFRQQDRAAFCPRLHGVRFVDQQDTDIMTAEVAGRFGRHDLERAAGTAAYCVRLPRYRRSANQRARAWR